MDPTAVPYLIVQRTLDFEVLGPSKVYICMCLIDHMIVGIGHTRDQALKAMVDAIREKNEEAARG